MLNLAPHREDQIIFPYRVLLYFKAIFSADTELLFSFAGNIYC